MDNNFTKQEKMSTKMFLKSISFIRLKFLLGSSDLAESQEVFSSRITPSSLVSFFLNPVINDKGFLWLRKYLWYFSLEGQQKELKEPVGRGRTANWVQNLCEIVFKTLFTQVLLIEILAASNHVFFVRNFEKLKAFSLKLKRGKLEEIICSFFIPRIPNGTDFKFEFVSKH